MEAISAHEYRVRKAEVIPADDLVFSEESMPLELSPRDARAVVKALKNPPRPNAAARRAARRLAKKFPSDG